MRSEGYGSRSVILSVCPHEFSQYRLQGGQWVAPTGCEQWEDGYQCGDFPETTVFQRYGVKTSEKAYASDPSRTRVCGCIPFAGASSDATDPSRTRVCCRSYISFAGACASARCHVVILVDLGRASGSWVSLLCQCWSLFSMDNKLSKVCPQCSTAVHVRWAVCGCGHAKRKAQSWTLCLQLRF